RAADRRSGGHPRTRGCNRHANGPGRCEGIARAGPWSLLQASRRPCARARARGRACARSGAEALAALGAATRQDLAAADGLHPCTEAVVALALEVAGLVRALGGHGDTLKGSGSKEPAILRSRQRPGQPPPARGTAVRAPGLWM